MSRTILLTLVISFLLLPIPSYSQENARIKITLDEVPTTEEIETQICVSWGAQIPNVPSSYLHSHYFSDKAGRTNTTVEHTTPTKDVDRKVTSYIVYGVIRSASSRDITRFIPAKFFETGNKSLAQQEVQITPRRNFNEAFLDSYPLEFNRDQGFLDSENVCPTLRAFRLLIDYAGEIDASISDDVWQRLFNFFQSNIGFFRKGGSAELTAVLNYLKTFTAASRREGVAKFYAEFLNGLVTIRGIEIGDNEDLTNYLHGQLMQLYETRLAECFVTADISLQKFHGIGEYEKSLTLATKILKSIDEQLLHSVLQSNPNNLFSILRQCTISGQDYYQTCSNIPGANRNNVTDGAKFLSQSRVGYAMMTEYLRVCDLMLSKGVITPKSTGRAGEILKFYIEYNCALQGGS